MKKLQFLMLVIAALYILLLLVAFLVQDNLLFYPEKLDKDFAYNLNPGDSEVFIKTADGILINGILYRRPGNTRVVLYFHGNAGSLRSWQDIAPEILSLNCDLLVIDNRGYGKSGGTFSEAGFYEDARASLKYLVNVGYKNDQVVVYGRSLGTGIATDLAVNQNIKCLVLESPYTSMPDLAAEKYPYLLPRLILKYKLNTLDKISSLNVPLLIFHGKNDELIPYTNAQKIFEAATVEKKLVMIDEGTHNNLSAFPEHFKALKDFLNSI